MNNSPLSIAFSFLALLMYSGSYLFKKKSVYLIFQGLGGLSLVFSYFFASNFFAMISLFIGLLRTTVYFLFECKNRKVPVYIVVILCVATLGNYYVLNFIFGQESNPLDLILALAFVLYAIIFSIRNLQLVRITIIVPLSLTILYNVLINAPIFTPISYSVELIVTVITLIYYYFYDKKKKEADAVKDLKSSE